MAVTINASTTTGLVQSADTSGIIELQNNGTTKLTVNSGGVTIPTATVTTLNTPTGVLATQNGMTGIAKAWVNFQGGNGNTAGTINGSFNVSSITVNGTGDYTANFTTAMPSANIVIAGSCKEADSGTSDGVFKIGEFASNPSTTTVRVVTGTVSSSFNMQLVMLAVFSS